MNEIRFLTVTALTRYIKKKFEVDSHLKDVWIKGELSNVKVHSRGHMYFTLKDQHSRIQGVMFSANNQSLAFQPENGMKVLIRGEISVYESYGQYQIYAIDMQPDGIGNLYLAFEQLKKKLDEEGLFDKGTKKPIPRYPKTIGVVTSETGAAIRDIVITLKRRFPVGKIILIPALVQGAFAAASIVKAIDQANMVTDLDVLIVGRGGGSIEDLWPFNEESVARAIYASKIPIISAVGHETDFTIADFVADLRAPTPTGAAELAVPHIDELRERVEQKKLRLYRAMKASIRQDKEKLHRLSQSYAFRYPKKLYIQKEQELDRLIERFERAGSLYYERKTNQLEHLESRLKRQHPYDKVLRSHERLSSIKKALDSHFQKVVKEKEFRYNQAISKLHTLNPLKVMSRGYSLVYEEENKLVKSIKQVRYGDNLKLRLKDGQVNCNVTGVEESETIE